MNVSHHIKVLIVDDDPSICKTVGLLLEDHGFDPRMFTHPDDALKIAEEEFFQIALVDLCMPAMDGVELVLKLKQIDNRMSCIVMTDYPDLESAIDAMRNGSCDYIAKPFKHDDLLSAVYNACRCMGIVYTGKHELYCLIGQCVRSHRRTQKITLRQLSDRAKLTKSQISQIELGKNAASIWALARISNSLGLKISQLFIGL